MWACRRFSFELLLLAITTLFHNLSLKGAGWGRVLYWLGFHAHINLIEGYPSWCLKEDSCLKTSSNSIAFHSDWLILMYFTLRNVSHHSRCFKISGSVILCCIALMQLFVFQVTLSSLVVVDVWIYQIVIPKLCTAAYRRSLRVCHQTHGYTQVMTMEGHTPLLLRRRLGVSWSLWHKINGCACTAIELIMSGEVSSVFVHSGSRQASSTGLWARFPVCVP